MIQEAKENLNCLLDAKHKGHDLTLLDSSLLNQVDPENKVLPKFEELRRVQREFEHLQEVCMRIRF